MLGPMPSFFFSLCPRSILCFATYFIRAYSWIATPAGEFFVLAFFPVPHPLPSRCLPASLQVRVCSCVFLWIFSTYCHALSNFRLYSFYLFFFLDIYFLFSLGTRSPWCRLTLIQSMHRSPFSRIFSSLRCTMGLRYDFYKGVFSWGVLSIQSYRSMSCDQSLDFSRRVNMRTNATTVGRSAHDP